MTKIAETRRAFKKRMAQKQDVLRPVPALMGDGAGVIEVPGQPGYVYIRVGDGDLGQAFNNRCPLADNLAIYVGYDPVTDPDRRIFQVLSVRMADYAGGGNTNIYPNIAAHHATHEFGGGDDVYVNWRRIMGFRVGRPSGFTVTIDGGTILRAGAWAAIGEQTIDLTAHKPGGLQTCYVLISLDATGVAIHAAGTPAVGADITSCPIPAANEIPLAAVRLYGTQTAIGDTPTAPDITDLRYPTTNPAGSAVYGSGTQYQLAVWTGASTIGGLGALGSANAVLRSQGAGANPAWSGFFLTGTAGGTTNFAVTNTKMLTLTAADDYNLTIPATGTAALINHANAGYLSATSFYIGAAQVLSETQFDTTLNVGISAGAGGAGLFSTLVGYEAGKVATGANSTFVGSRAGLADTTGYNNTLIGAYAGDAIIGGFENVVVGAYGGRSIVANYRCVYIGASVATNATGLQNIAIGYQAMNSTAAGAGANNFAAGVQALYTLNNGNFNWAGGYQALYLLTDGASNFAGGNQAAYSITTASYCVAIGHNALYSNQTNSHLIAIGTETLYNCVSDYNTAVGSYALHSVTNQGENTAVGSRAGYTTTGFGNVFVGYCAGKDATGNGSVIVGYQAGYSSAGSCVFIGYNAGYYEAGSSKLYIANNETTTPLIYGDFSTATLTFYKSLNKTNTLETILNLNHSTSGAAAAGFGLALDWYLESSTTADQQAGRISYLWADATHATRKARSIWSVWDTTEREGIRIEADGSNPMIGFLGASAVVRQLATTDLGVALSNLGLRVAGTAYPITTSGAVSLTGSVTIGTMTATDYNIVCYEDEVVCYDDDVVTY